jgi:hypothetical protein
VTIVETNVVALDPPREVGELVAALVAAGIQVRAVEPLRLSLEQFYFGKVGRD